MTGRRRDLTTRPVARPRTRRTGVILAALTALTTFLATACGAGGQAAAPTTVVPESVTLLTAKGPMGTYLTDSSGRALYMWDADRQGTSTCYGDCAVAWPPLTVRNAAEAGPGVQASLLGTEKRKDGTEQVTYNGWPLYYFAPDKKPGELTGQGNTGFGAVWWVLAPDGEPLPSD